MTIPEEKNNKTPLKKNALISILTLQNQLLPIEIHNCNNPKSMLANIQRIESYIAFLNIEIVLKCKK